jgi:1,2-diacylglycerol 3-beta-glucosyltransferase
MALTRHHLPLLTPLTYVVISLSGWGMYQGLNRLELQSSQPRPSLLSRLGQTIFGTIYMLHWLVIMPCVTARMAIRPKRLKWVKTVHAGNQDESLALKGSES